LGFLGVCVFTGTFRGVTIKGPLNFELGPLVYLR